MEDANLEGRQYGVGVSGGGVDNAPSRTRQHHFAGYWIFQKDAPNAANSVLRKPML